MFFAKVLCLFYMNASTQVKQMNTRPTHAAGDTAHAQSTGSCKHNCPHHLQALLYEAGCITSVRWLLHRVGDIKNLM
jgi:hypothetical protein